MYLPVAFEDSDDDTIWGGTRFIPLSQLDFGALQRFFPYPSFFHTFTLTSLSHATPSPHITPHITPAQRYPHISLPPPQIIVCKTLHLPITTPSTPPQAHSASSMNEKTQKRGNAKWSFIRPLYPLLSLPQIIVLAMSRLYLLIALFFSIAVSAEYVDISCDDKNVVKAINVSPVTPSHDLGGGYRDPEVAAWICRVQRCQGLEVQGADF